MTFILPTVNNAHNVDPNLNARFLAEIGSLSSVDEKDNGNLPLSDVAGQWRTADVAGTVGGIGYEFQASQAAWDLSSDTKVLLWQNQANVPNRIQVGTIAQGGYRIRVYSGTGSMPTDYKEFHVGGNDSPAASNISGQFPFSIDLNDISEDLEVGTFDNTDVTSYSFVIETQDMVGTGDSWMFPGNSFVLDTTKASASTPTFSGSGSEPEDAVFLVQGTDFTDKIGNWVRQAGSVIFIDMAFRLGNNSSITTFNDNGLTIISPVSNDTADPRVRVTTQAFRTYLNLRNNVADTATFSGTWIWQTRAPFDWDQDDAAVVTFTNPTFSGMGAFTLGSSITGPATWDDVDPVIFADTGVDVDGSTFRNQNGSHALEMTAGAMDIATMRFEDYASAHAILIDTAGTYNFDNVFFDQSGTNDIETTHATGTVTINILNGGTVPTVTETGAGAVVINVIVTINVMNVTEGTSVTVIADETVGTITTGDVIFNLFADASGVAQITDFNYESAFNPSGLDVIARTRNQGISSAVIADDNGVFTDETTEGNSTAAGDMNLLPTTPVVNQDRYVFGHQDQFTRLKVNVSTAGTGGFTITWEYWNGSSFTALSDVVDGTSSFSVLGENIISFTLPGDWATSTINSQGPFYYIRAAFTAGSVTITPLGRKCTLDVTRYLPFVSNAVVTETGLTVAATWTVDSIAKFDDSD